MVKICLVRPGSTSFDEEGRIKGCLDMPLCARGLQQAQQVAASIAQKLQHEPSTVSASTAVSVTGSVTGSTAKNDHSLDPAHARLPKSKSSDIAAIYSAPCQSAQETANVLSESFDQRVKVVDCMLNVDHGLWQGKLIDEVKRTQPTIYRSIQEHPEVFAPPGGETLDEAQARVRRTVEKILRKHRDELIILVVPEPLASLVKQLLVAGDFGDLWKAERDEAKWELITVEGQQLALT